MIVKPLQVLLVGVLLGYSLPFITSIYELIPGAFCWLYGVVSILLLREKKSVTSVLSVVLSAINILLLYSHQHLPSITLNTSRSAIALVCTGQFLLLWQSAIMGSYFQSRLPRTKASKQG